MKPSLKDSIGSIIEVAASDSPEDGVYRGQVVGIDQGKGLLQVAFDTEEDGGQFVDEIPWSSSEIIWIHEVPAIRSCTGYSVEVGVEGSSAGEYYVGRILRADPGYRTILVDYDVNPGDPHDREFMYATDPRILRWIPPLRSVTIPVEDATRPPIEQSVGFYVYVGRERDPDLLAKVVSFDSSKRTVRVAFLSKGEDPNEEDLPYLSSELQLVKKQTVLNESKEESLCSATGCEDGDTQGMHQRGASGSRKVHAKPEGQGKVSSNDKETAELPIDAARNAHDHSIGMLETNSLSEKAGPTLNQTTEYNATLNHGPSDPEIESQSANGNSDEQESKADDRGGKVKAAEDNAHSMSPAAERELVEDSAATKSRSKTDLPGMGDGAHQNHDNIDVPSKNESPQPTSYSSKIIYSNGDVYEGTVVDGERHGYGVYSRKDTNSLGGIVFDGPWSRNNRTGKMKVTVKNGAVMEGEYGGENWNGAGYAKLSLGEIYEGHFKNGKYDGQGRIQYRNGDCYDGTFANGMRHGSGVCKFANGDEYDGEYLEGKCNGRGVMKYASGDVYSGSWANNEKNGLGTMTFASGDLFTGNYVKGQKSGPGTMKFVNGDVYEGNYLNDKFDGAGVYTYPDGTKYDGEFSDGKYNGKGTLSYSKGDVYQGDWKGREACYFI